MVINCFLTPNETVGKVPFRTPTHQTRHSAMKLPLCRRISTMRANTHHADSDAFLSVFSFRSSTFATAYCLSKSVSIWGFPTVSTPVLSGAALPRPLQVFVRRHVCLFPICRHFPRSTFPNWS